MERNDEMKTYVMDTSVIIKWFSEYDEDDLDNALNLRYEILEGKCFVIVPDLLFYELANALRYNVRFTDKDVKDAVKSVIDMGFDVRRVELEIINLAVEIAYRVKVTVYDAYFLALSTTEKRPFVTADYRFVKSMKDFKNIIKLSEI